MRGHAEIGRVIEVISRYDRTFHLLGQSRYDRADGGGDVLTGEVWCTAHHRWRDAEAQREHDHVMYIRYEDEYRRGSDDRWRIAARTVGVDWTETRVVDVPGATP